MPPSDPLELVIGERPARGLARLRLGALDVGRATAAIEVGGSLWPAPFVKTNAEIRHRRELALAGLGDRLGALPRPGAVRVP